MKETATLSGIRFKRQANSKRLFDPPAQRDCVRLSNVYATPWQLAEDADQTLPGEYLRLGRLAEYFNGSAAQLPKVIQRIDLDHDRIAFRRWDRLRLVTGARLWLLVVPSRQIVAVLSLDVTCELAHTIDLLEDCYYLDVKVEGQSVTTLAAEALGMGGVFLPERHQIAFGPIMSATKYDDIVQRVIYRADLPYRKEFSAITYPMELNRNPGAVAAVGPYVSVLCGQQDYVENSVFLSAIQGVASAARLREIRATVYSAVSTFRATDRTHQGTQMRRKTLESLSGQLGNMELDLSYSVEATADLGLLVPSLRVAGYHDALYEAMGLGAKAETVARMLRRLERATAAELTAIESQERRADEDRRLRWAIAIGFVSTLAVPVGLILAFLGINAREVDNSWSMFDVRYLPVYALAVLIVLSGVLVSAALYAQQRRAMRRNGKSEEPAE
ncbi:hypothetical protein [Nonomuraea rhodomycinica]|uniref:CorA-like Mg2+ transporter protein n=1 Tax=Nonomuraea rhodomycinica TaxID=1712872 RepID=A0A7Y6MG72_9ACTN|nr:hypothetical protein [Nonomuraea rhodomycinica]NUW45770.1 hypothetical protein [Nonomuraea rhodomycinica]